MCFFDETADTSSPYCRRREHSRSRHLHGYIFGDFFQKVAYFQAFRVNSSRKFGLETASERKTSRGDKLMCPTVTTLDQGLPHTYDANVATALYGTRAQKIYQFLEALWHADPE